MSADRPCSLFVATATGSFERCPEPAGWQTRQITAPGFAVIIDLCEHHAENQEWRHGPAARSAVLTPFKATR